MKVKSRVEEKGRRAGVEQRTGWVLKNSLEKQKLFPPRLAQSERGMTRGVSMGGRAPLPSSMGGTWDFGRSPGDSTSHCLLFGSLEAHSQMEKSHGLLGLYLLFCLYRDTLRGAIRAMHPSKHGVSAEKMSLRDSATRDGHKAAASCQNLRGLRHPLKMQKAQVRGLSLV